MKKSRKEIMLNKLTAHMASEVSGATPEWKRNITSIWNNFVNLACYMEDEMTVREEEMQKEFASWKKVKPIMAKDKEGKIVVTGILKPETKTKKKYKKN